MGLCKTVFARTLATTRNVLMAFKDVEVDGSHLLATSALFQYHHHSHFYIGM
jgi:hypothetical protein